MSFDYIKNIYDGVSRSLLESPSFVVNATIYIAGTEITHDSMYVGVNSPLDGRSTEIIQSDFPLDLPRFVRIKVFPMERNYLRYQSSPIEHTLAGNYEPFDKWVSCLESDVAVRVNETYYDYSSHIVIEGVRYKLKAKHKETFGIKPIVHAFLVKESDE